VREDDVVVMHANRFFPVREEPFFMRNLSLHGLDRTLVESGARIAMAQAQEQVCLHDGQQ
jgi:hypothetical protein